MLLRAMLSAAVLVSWGNLAHGEDARLTVNVGFSTMLQADQTIKTAIVGNEKLIDVRPESDRTLSITGKVAGNTNLLLLDEAGRPFSNVSVAVTSVVGGGGKVLIHARKDDLHNYRAYQCDPVCSRVEDAFEREDPVPLLQNTVTTLNNNQGGPTPAPIPPANQPPARVGR